MTRTAGMLARVAILRVVAASDVTARAAQAQMHPGVAHCQAFDASFARWHDALDAARNDYSPADPYALSPRLQMNSMVFEL